MRNLVGKKIKNLYLYLYKLLEKSGNKKVPSCSYTDTNTSHIFCGRLRQDYKKDTINGKTYE